MSSWTALDIAPGLSFSDAILFATLGAFLLLRPADMFASIRDAPWLGIAVVAVGLLAWQQINRQLGLTVLEGFSEPNSLFLFRAVLCFVLLSSVVSMTTPFASSGPTIVAWTAGVCAGAVVAIGLFYSGLQNTLGALQHIPTTRATGLTDHPNTLAEASSLALPILVAVLVEGRRNILRALVALGLAACIWSIFLSGSRGGLIIGAGALLLQGMLSLSRRSGSATAAVILGLASLLVAITAGPALLSTTRFGSSNGADSSEGRASSIQLGWGLFQSSPISGAGLGAWYGELVPVILLSSGGVLLAAAFYFLIGRSLWTGVRAKIWSPLLVSFAAVLVWGAFNNALLERYIYWIPVVVSMASVNSNAAARTTR